MIDSGKTRMIVLPYGEKNYDDMLSRFHPIPGRYGRTDRIATSISRVSVLTRDKKRIIPAIITGIISSFFFCIIHRIHCAGLTVDPPTKTVCQKLEGSSRKLGGGSGPPDHPVVAPL